jgi:rhodanese-related sulfurtransferase
MMMKRIVLQTALLVASLNIKAQQDENWTLAQLMSPSLLASEINSKKQLPVIISVGPGGVIPNSLVAGMANTREGLVNLQEHLNTLSKESKVVVYCGCCPYEHCPNVRPAMALLKKLGFTNYYLLDLPHNIKTDWIDKGYPTAK